MNGTNEKIGEVLRRVVPLSRQDIEEIVQLQQTEQRGLRFGEIALSLGLCSPEHIWRAWGEQLIGRDEEIDLEEIGIDSQAVCAIPLCTAAELGVIAIRSLDDLLIVATSHEQQARAQRELPLLVKKNIRWVIAPLSQIQDAITSYYVVEDTYDRAA